MNTNIIDYLALQHELKDIKEKVEVLECHIDEMELDEALEIHKCPFCGSPMVIEKSDKGYAVFCSFSECYLYGEFGHRFYPSILHAVDAWNGAFHVKPNTKDVLALPCPACGTKSRTIKVPTEDGKIYYQTMCGNRRCELENLPDGVLFKNEEASIDFWNKKINDWNP